MSRSRIIREGSLGLFIILGFIVFGGAILFLRGNQFRQQSYQVRLLFDNVGGLREGGRVLYRGVEVGKISSIEPGVDGVEVITDIDRELKMPTNILVETTQSGLLGEVVVTIVPQETLSARAQEINPLSQECLQQTEVICNNQRITGQYSGDLIANMTRLTTVFSDPAFFEQLDDAINNVSLAASNIAKLSDDLSVFMDLTGQDISKITDVADSIITTSESLSNTANTSTQQINRLSNQFSDTATEISTLTRNANQLIETNKSSLRDAIVSLSNTSKEATQLIKNTNNIVTKVDDSVNSIDVAKVSQDLSKAISNLEQVTNNLTALSKELNDPTNLVTLQQTLDSARVTFANTAKITSDIDDLTGDPQFRENMRRLVDGLSDLLSYTDVLEKQVELATLLNQAEKVVEESSPQSSSISDENFSYSIINHKFPKVISSNPSNKKSNK
jgi:phospholipid/cholesterol/gamma-HCH transport system substrate-binding protein